MNISLGPITTSLVSYVGMFSIITGPLLVITGVALLALATYYDIQRNLQGIEIV